MSDAGSDSPNAEDLLALLQADAAGVFEVDRLLGRGGMAVVFLATETALGRRVAIKVLPPEYTYGSHAIERFRREARTAAALTHPNIIPIYRISTGGKLFWYAMLFLEGRSLADLLTERGKLTLDETTSILSQVASALDHAHGKGVIHRDIKPANIMLAMGGHVSVTDFGIAKQLDAGTLTASGSVIGTPFYMSPEQCRGLSVTGAADQYSTAVMAFEMLAGTRPFESDSAIDLLRRHCMEPPRSLTSLNPALPGYVSRAVERALAKSPEDRHGSVAAFVRALKGEGSDLDPTTPLARLASRTAANRRSRTFRGKGFMISIVAATGVILTGVVLKLTWARRPGTARPPARRFSPSARTSPTQPSLWSMTTNRNPLVNFAVPAGTIRLRFEVSDQSGAWSRDTVVQVGAGDTLNLGRVDVQALR